MKAWKVILAALVIFSAGVVTGGLTMSRQSLPAPPAHRNNAQAPWNSRPRGDFLGRMQRELSLNKSQSDQIEQHLRESQDQMKQLWEAEQRKLRDRIRNELTPDQKSKYEEVFKRRGPSKSGDPKGHDKRRGPEDHRNSPPRGAPGTTSPPPTYRETP